MNILSELVQYHFVEVTRRASVAPSADFVSHPPLRGGDFARSEIAN